MKKILFFMLTLMISTVAFADGGIPLLVFFGSNIFVTGIPSGLGLLLFWIVYRVEKNYLSKKAEETKELKKAVLIANIYSTLWGIPLTIALIALGFYIPCFNDSPNGLSAGLYGPAYNIITWLQLPASLAFILGLLLYFLIFITESWFVEYRYLRRKLKIKELKKQVLIANLYSYAYMTAIIGIIPLLIAVARYFG